MPEIEIADPPVLAEVMVRPAWNARAVPVSERASMTMRPVSASMLVAPTK